MPRDYQYLLPDDQEELMRTLEDRIMSRLHHVHPGIVTKSTEDGNTAEAKVAVKGQQMDWESGKSKDVDIADLKDVPIHFAGGGGKGEDSTVLTHPVTMAKDQQGNADEKNSDEGILIMSSRAHGNWWKNGGAQPPVDLRRNRLTPLFIPGVRSQPRKYKYHDNKTMQARSFDKMHVFTQDPKTGMTHRSVETAQDKDKDPYENPKDFYEHTTIATKGVISKATKGHDKKATETSTSATNHYRKTIHDGTFDSIGKQGTDDWHTHVGSETGFKTSVDSGKHTTDLNKDEGYKASINNGSHTFDIHKDNGINATSSSKFDITAPTHNVTAETNIKSHNINVDQNVNAQNVNASQNVAATGNVSGSTGSFGSVGASSMSATGLVSGATMAFSAISGLLSSGGGAGSGVGAGAMQDGAASTNVGSLSGDLSGNLPAPVILVKSYTFTTLPASPAIGRLAVVTDATVNTWRANVTVGGGTNKVLVWWNGTNWTVMG